MVIQTQIANLLSNTVFFKLVVTLTLLVGLAACGGGSGSSDTASSNTKSNTETTTNVSSEQPKTEVKQPTAQAKSFSELTVDQTFEFTNSNKLSLDINIANLANISAYVSVCQVVENGAKYDDCLYRGRLVNGMATAKIELPNHIDELSMAIWYLDGSNQRSQHVWQRNQGMNWQVR